MFDNHTHSKHSTDSKMELASMITEAKNRNLKGVAITDHYDYNCPLGPGFFVYDPAIQQEDIDKHRETTDLKILKGVEIGMQPELIVDMIKFSGSYRFDTIVASLHYIDGTDPYHGGYYEKYNAKEAYGRYLETIYDCISQFHNFDILGHYDYIARYAPYPETSITFKEFGYILDPILKELVNYGQTFEINTKTYHLFGNREPLLDIDIIKRFKELGGEAVSLGSDAHDTKRLGDNFHHFIDILKSCGFNKGIYFENREAKYYKY